MPAKIDAPVAVQDTLFTCVNNAAHCRHADMFPLQTLQTVFAILCAKSHLSKPCLQSYLRIPSLQTLFPNAVCKPIILMQTCSGHRGVNAGNGTLHLDSIECTPSTVVAQARGYALLMLSHMIRMLGDGPAIALAHWSYCSRVQILSWPSHPLHATSLQVVQSYVKPRVLGHPITPTHTNTNRIPSQPRPADPSTLHHRVASLGCHDRTGDCMRSAPLYQFPLNKPLPRRYSSC